MKIPLHHFSTTPVFTLGPTAACRDSGDELDAGSVPFQRGVKKSGSFREKISEIPSFFRSSVGSVTPENLSAPNSPLNSRTRKAASCAGQRMLQPNLQKSQLMTSSLTSFSTTEEDEYANTTVATGCSVSNLNSGPDSMDGTQTIGRSFYRSRKNPASSMMTICTDCREMVLQVIRAQSTAKRLQMAKSLFMGINPGPKESMNPI